MNSAYLTIALSIMLVSGIATVPSYAQVTDPITVGTDKESYSAGETVTVTGEIRKSLQGAVALKVIAPNGNRITFDQLTVGDDDTFTTTFVAGGPLWRTPGTYSIDVTYGVTASNIVTGVTTIEYTGGTVPTTPPVTPPPSDDPLAGITSSINGGTITSITHDPGANSLTVVIDATDDGELTLNVPRDIFESKDGSDGKTGEDMPFIILVDGSEGNAVETTSAGTRTLVIGFTAGTEVIELIGTWIIPEFGVIAIAILAVAIVSIIAISSRSSVSILPRY